MAQTQLPPWRSLLAVVAHPDDESFALGAVLAAFAEAGAQVSVLCLTRGEASTLHGVAGDLTELRTDELTAAAAALGLHKVALLAYPDGGLPEVHLDQLAAHVVTTAWDVDADGLIGFDVTGVTGHPTTPFSSKPSDAIPAGRTRQHHVAPHRAGRRQRATAMAPPDPGPLNGRSSKRPPRRPRRYLGLG